MGRKDPVARYRSSPPNHPSSPAPPRCVVLCCKCRQKRSAGAPHVARLHRRQAPPLLLSQGCRLCARCPIFVQVNQALLKEDDDLLRQTFLSVFREHHPQVCRQLLALPLADHLPPLPPLQCAQSAI